MAGKKTFKNNPAISFISAAEEEPIEQIQTGGAIPKGYMLVKETKSERAQFLLRPSTKNGLKALARAQKRSINDLVNDILEEYLERNTGL